MGIDIGSFLRAILFLGIPFVAVIFYLQWRWAKTCDNYIQCLVAERSGGGRFFLAPKSGGQVTIMNPETGDVRTWAINELATIDVPYPGVGFVPRWMQKTIRMAILSEGDWEPLLNRSPHRQKIASPDVVAWLQQLARDYPDVAPAVEQMLSGISTGPTREIVGDPAFLGQLQQAGVMRALASVSNDLMEQLKSINRRLANFVTMNPLLVYILLGLAVIVNLFVAYQVMQLVNRPAEAVSLAELTLKVDQIRVALGIK